MRLLVLVLLFVSTALLGQNVLKIEMLGLKDSYKFGEPIHVVMKVTNISSDSVWVTSEVLNNSMRLVDSSGNEYKVIGYHLESGAERYLQPGETLNKEGYFGDILTMFYGTGQPTNPEFPPEIYALWSRLEPETKFYFEIETFEKDAAWELYNDYKAKLMEYIYTKFDVKTRSRDPKALQQLVDVINEMKTNHLNSWFTQLVRYSILKSYIFIPTIIELAPRTLDARLAEFNEFYETYPTSPLIQDLLRYEKGVNKTDAKWKERLVFLKEKYNLCPNYWR